ncbi:PREDICTED: uncharacterized protein LOC105971162 [Erythranthe guttata]|uniref:uncharacterized protein LOC105971162 n=1 Tax=Erythranthe guttata TaxID=4155 RepID=UPI00064DD076|nr:PREDICTED: uncharacterized protein LOC105971162 [Erythranthe guttata]XP_012851466.1 PREDICTED: uncharacterized protein LOC105971162 [Erythranthe guttata]|eukprot:XP_012851465.1 PREDICTED: uncharacterized protein LOC105971162 [Erythranthe guttata]
MSSKLFTLRLNYGGNFSNMDFEYVGGMVSMVADVDPDLMSYFEMLGIIKELQLSATTVIWYNLPNENGLNLLDSDSGVLQMFKKYSDVKVFQVDLFLQDVDIDISCDVMSSHEANAEMGMGVGAEVDIGADAEVDMGIDADEDESDPSYVADNESESGSDFDFFAEGDTMSESFHPLGTDYIGDDGEEISQPFDPEINLEQAFDASEDAIQSDPEVLSEPNESDEESKGRKFPEFEEENSLKEPLLEVGLVFCNIAAYRKALRQFSVLRGIDLIYDKNETKRVTAQCKNKCGWRIHASVMGTSTAFQIKSFKGEPHRCPRSFTNKSANSSYLADRYIDTFMETPTLPVDSFKKLVRREVKVYAHRQKLYRAKKKAIEKIQGNVHEQYSRIRHYCYEILKTNPGSTAIVRTEGPPLYRIPRF